MTVLQQHVPLGRGGLPNVYLDDSGDLVMAPDLADDYRFRGQNHGRGRHELVTGNNKLHVTKSNLTCGHVYP
jgi:hypothetical protein